MSWPHQANSRARSSGATRSRSKRANVCSRRSQPARHAGCDKPLLNDETPTFAGVSR